MTITESDIPEPVTALFPAPGERERRDDRLTRELAAAARRVAAGGVAPRFDAARFDRELAGFDFAAPAPLDEIVPWVVRQLEHGVTHMTHPRYFGLFNPAPNFPAQCADRIAAAFNPQLASATTSPAAVAIEAHVIEAVGRRAGFAAGAAGHFTSGGAEANATALLCALTRAEPRFAGAGARAFAGPPLLYASRDSHLAWLKIAHQAGIGRDAMRLVPTDGSGRMDAAALAGMVECDRRRGAAPVMVAATAGTTNAGMIDPLGACADVARRFGMWLHVDAAWGGALVASDRLRGALAGLERADSATIDAHKWLATTMGCGMFLTPHRDILPAVFHVAASYMPSNDAARDPYVTSQQWSRRFVGLRLFMALAAAGWDGYARHVERAVALAALLADRLREQRWRVVNGSPLAVLCLAPPAGEVRDIVARVVGSGRAWVSAAMFEDRPVVRACITHGETSAGDIGELVSALAGAAAASCGRNG